MTDTADIVVIGGGIAGISAAAALAEEARVTVLEAEAQPGRHSTGRSAAIFIRNYGNATLRALNDLSHPALSGGLIGDSVLSPRGEMIVAGPDDLDTLAAYLDGAEGMERLTPAEACEIVPVLRPETIAAAAIERDAQDIDVDRLLQGCLRLLRHRGGTIGTGAQVQAIDRDGTGWRIRTATHDLSAGIVINAAGAWADEVAVLAGLPRIGLQPMRRSAVIMPVPAAVGEYRRWPLFAAISDAWYAKPEATGLMISPADEDPVDPHDAWPDDMVIAEGLYRFEQMVDIPVVRPSHSWAGLRSFVPDRSPVCGFEPEAPGFFWLAGQGGYGVQTSPALADLTAALCLGRNPGSSGELRKALDPARLRNG